MRTCPSQRDSGRVAKKGKVNQAMVVTREVKKPEKGQMRQAYQRHNHREDYLFHRYLLLLRKKSTSAHTYHSEHGVMCVCGRSGNRCTSLKQAGGQGKVSDTSTCIGLLVPGGSGNYWSGRIAGFGCAREGARGSIWSSSIVQRCGNLNPEAALQGP